MEPSRTLTEEYGVIVVFLGHIVGRRGLACDPAKLSAVRKWHAPDKVKGVRQFVGFVSYYRRFVKEFADMSSIRLSSRSVSFAEDVTVLGDVSPSVCSPEQGKPTQLVSVVAADDVIMPVGETVDSLNALSNIIPPPPRFS